MSRGSPSSTPLLRQPFSKTQRLPKSCGLGSLDLFASNRTPNPLLDVVGVAEIEAIVNAAQGVEHLWIDPVLDVVDRAVGKHGVHAGRMRRSHEGYRSPG